MGYNTIYYGSFYDSNKDKITVNIKQLDFTGNASSLLFDVNPVVISCTPKEFDDQLFSSGCKINVINNTNNFFKFDPLFAKPQRSNYVEIYKDSSSLDASVMMFQGYILPELYTTTLEKNIKLTISATDQLNMLDRYQPEVLIDTPTYRAEELVYAIDMISNIVSDCSTTPDVAINNELTHGNFTKEVSTTIFNNILFDANNFYDSDGLLYDKDCIEMVLKPFYSRMYYHNGKWKIERVKDLGTTNKNFAQYRITDSVGVIPSSFTEANSRINLYEHYMISKSAQLTYNPGYQNVNIILNYKQPDNLVDNYYYDWSYYVKEVSIDSLKPQPKQRKWMLSSTDASLTASMYHDNNLKTGMYFTISSNWPSGTEEEQEFRWEWLKGAFASTMFLYNPNKDNTTVSVKYQHSIDPASFKTTDKFKARYALRTFDVSTNKDWWIAKHVVTNSSTYWSDVPYVYEVEELGTNITNYMFEINKQIDITKALESNSGIGHFTKTIKTLEVNLFGFTWSGRNRTVEYLKEVAFDDQKVKSLYLDIYAMQRYTNWATNPYTYKGVKTQFGNVDVDISTPVPYNVVAGYLDEFNDKKDVEIDIFDASTILFTNGIYNRDTNLTTNTISGWSDDNVNFMKLQYKLLEDMAQMYNKPRYSMTLDVINKDSSLWSLGNIYTHSNIKYPDNSLIEFMCNGFDYNVKENAYRLSLLEYISDDNWRINA